MADLFADDIVGIDHRALVGGGAPIVGRAANVAANRGVMEVGVTSLRVTPLEARGERLVLLRAEYSGPMGDMEVLQVLGLDPDDRLVHTEVFDLGQRDAAVARLDQLEATSS
jgi:hypothetical protein